MPIYEYRCTTCSRAFDHFARHPVDGVGARCPACGATDVTRRFSSFATHRSERSRLTDFDPSRARDPEFYRDSRNIGLAAKLRAQQLGVHTEGRLDEIVEKARTGRFLDQ